MKSVLILLSTYNGERYLAELLDSLIDQKNVSLSILARDDGSKDASIKVLNTYRDKCQIEIVEGENVGAVRSFLELVYIAPLTYDYYALCDQDDVWMENKLEKAIEKLKLADKENMSLYYSGQRITNECLNVIYNHLLDANRSYSANFIFNQVAGCTMVVNQNLIKKLKEYIPSNIYMHDAWCYKVCVALGGTAIVEPEGYIFYRQHGNNVVGLDNGVVGKVKRAYDYIFKYNCSSYAIEILKGYEKDLDEYWKGFMELICAAKKSIRARLKLMMAKDICFDDKRLKIIFLIKVLMGRI